jgi:phosphotriesterase-related protein
MLPYMEEAYSVGIRALVECSTVGVGRNVAILKHLAQATPIHLIAPTGVYREGYIPEELIPLSSEELSEMWVRDLTEGIDRTNIKAGFIKIAMSDDGPTPLEERNLKAAVITSRKTGAVIASHTISGAVAFREIDLLQALDFDLSRFIWVHAQIEQDNTFLLEAAKLGVIIELDTVGAPWQDEGELLKATISLIEAGFAAQLLLSHDAGWYQSGEISGQPEGGIRGYTALVEEFLPRLELLGVGNEIVEKVTVSNPARLFAFGNSMP